MNGRILLAIALLAFFAMTVLAGCTLVLRMRNPAPEPQVTLPPLPTLAPTEVAAVATSAPVEICASPLTPGVWTGQGSLQGTAGTAGVNVIQQQGLTRLNLLIACDGSVTGAAQGANSTTIKYPLFLSGSCSGNNEQEVTGQVVPGPAGDAVQARLRLQFTVKSGKLDCEVDSRLPNVPSGAQSEDLTNRVYENELVVDQVAGNTVRGGQWNDLVYAVLLERFGPMIEQSGLTPETSTSWELTRQP